MTSIIEAIKAKIDIVEEIGPVANLQKAGKNYKGLCPFHNERTPSFYVFTENQTWHCFGCHESGDIFSFVQKQQNLEFREALGYLAAKAGVALDDQATSVSEEDRERNVARERLRKLNEEALLWFHHMLLRSKEAVEAREYVQSRGISMDTVLAFALGYAPDHWNGLTGYLSGQGYTEQELINAGLARMREGDEQEGTSSRVYDYFRNRLIFPIRDIRGRVIGFGGRALGDGKPKYLNSPQTVLFEKNSVLYAIDMAKDAIKHAHQVVIVEGYVDAIIAHQYGTKQTVACIGSAITEKHIQQLKKLTRQVTLALDPDAAGSAATEHGIQEALKTFDRTVVPVPIGSGTTQSNKSSGQKRNASRRPQVQGIVRLEEQVDAEINVLQLPDGEDPDEFIRRDYATWFYKVTHPIALIDYYFDVKTADINLREPVGQMEAARRLLPIIGMINDRIKRDGYIRKLAAMIHMDERSLHEELQSVLRKQKTSAVNAEFSAPTIKGSGTQRLVTPQSPVAPGEGEPSSRGATQQHEGGLDRRKANKIQLEDYLNGLLLLNPTLNQYVCGIIDVGDFAGADTRELYHVLSSVYQQRASSPSLQSFEQFVPPELLETATRARECVESMSPKDEAGLVKEATQCASRLKRTRLLQLNTELKYLLNEAVASGDSSASRQHRLSMVEVHQQLRTIDTATHLQG
jgi:DNA primase